MAQKIKFGKQSVIPAEELDALTAQTEYYKRGTPYHWVLTYGWCIVGYYVKHISPLQILVAHKNFYSNANTDHGTFVIEGPAKDITWRYRGHGLITVPQIIHVDEYHSEVPHGPVMVK